MKRDVELINEILVALQDANSASLDVPKLEILLQQPGRKVERHVLLCHLRLARDRNWVSDEGVNWRLTWDGYDYLESPSSE